MKFFVFGVLCFFLLTMGCKGQPNAGRKMRGTTVRSNAIRYNRKIDGPSPIKTFLIDTWKLCHHHCKREPNCRSWTWILVPYGGVCHLYSVSNAPKKIQYGAVTGINIAASSP